MNAAERLGLTPAALQAIFAMKYGPPGELGWAPAMRARFRHFNPDEHYEALVDQLVGPTTRWLDVGCGRELFPSNRPLARVLADRCRRLVGVDPDATLDENPFVHERVALRFDDYAPAEPFDLVTMRMVAEHVTEPDRVVAALARSVVAGGHVVVYTVDRWSPVPLVTSIVPFALHQPIKRLLWGTHAKDTFATAFRMNTRRRLDALLRAGGFVEERFARVDDCRTLAQFRIGQWLELSAWRAMRWIGLGYPEACLIGLYRRA